MHAKPEPEEAFVASRETAWVLTVGLLLLVLIPAPLQTLLAPQAELRRFAGLISAAPSHLRLASFERALSESSLLGKFLRTKYRSVTLPLLRQGAHDVILGGDGALFYRPDVELVTQGPFPGTSSPESHPSVEVMADFSDNLKKRGVHLLIVPAPVAPMIYPEQVWANYFEGEPEIPGYNDWLQGVRRRGVDVVDLRSEFREARSGNERLFALRNTHWRPRGISLAAGAVAQRARAFLDAGGPKRFVVRRQSVPYVSDLIPKLGLDDDGSFFPREFATVDVVSRIDEPVESKQGAPVLLLGDSFSDIFSGADPDGGGPAGFAAQLEAALDVPVETLVRSGVRNNEMREELSRRPDALRGKRVLIWEFCIRNLVFAWNKRPLPPP